MKKDPIKLNTIENANAIVRGKEIPNGQLDMVICDPPQYSNINDRLLNNWKTHKEYYDWFNLYMNIVAIKLKRTGIFFLIGAFEENYKLIEIIKQYKFELEDTYYFLKNKKHNTYKKNREIIKTTPVVDCIMVFTRSHVREVKTLLLSKQQENKLTPKDMNIYLSGNGEGGGYWSLYCGENRKNIIPSQEHWDKLNKLFDIDIEYSIIQSQYRPYDGINIWDEEIYFEERNDLVKYIDRPKELYERIFSMNRNELSKLVIWDSFIGYGNCIKVCKKYSISYYGHEMNCDVFIKAKLNI